MTSLYLHKNLEITKENKLHPLNNKFYFRKYIDTKYVSHYTEYKICKILKKNPHKNIVTIYEVTHKYIDMELLDLTSNKCNYIELCDALEHLHSLNIVYLDIFRRNIGFSKETGELKLFDFNCSGILKGPLEWEREPFIYGIMYQYVVRNCKVQNYIYYDYILLTKFLKKYQKPTKKNIFYYLRKILELFCVR